MSSSTPITSIHQCDLYIGDNQRNWGDIIDTVEWKSFINNGFSIHIKLDDHGYDLLDTIFGNDKMGVFRKARQNQDPLTIRFRLRWQEGYSTPWRTAIISDITASGKAGYGGKFGFVAVDPISFYLNNGDCSGRVWKGNVGGNDGVIMQVLNQYVPNTIATKSVSKFVSPTTDAKSMHWMMRQDPKGFIQSLLDWSSSFTKSRTSWIVSNGEDEDNIIIRISESHSIILGDPSPIGDLTGPLVFSYGSVENQIKKGDILNWEMLHDSFIVALNTNLVTSGISAVSGKYLDRVVDRSKNEVYVTDDNTALKVNASFGPDRGYSKPSGKLERGWTHIGSIPEFNAGDVGAKYGKYIDGKARQLYMDMLNMVMRIRVTVTGEPRLFDQSDLGRSQVSLKWLGVEDQTPRFMDGNWLMYGWHHKMRRNWETDVYLARLDYDALAMPGLLKNIVRL